MEGIIENLKHFQYVFESYVRTETWTEYHILKLIFLRIIIQKFMMIGQLFHVKNVFKNVKNQQV